jgi:hypothetical protein
MSSTEDFAEKHADQWQGCCECRESHHRTSFCKNCGRCFFRLIPLDRVVTDDYTFVYCTCGHNDLWD